MSRKEQIETKSAEPYENTLQKYYEALSKQKGEAGIVGNEELKLRLFLSLIQRPATQEWPSSEQPAGA
jgi:hypothetical protein